MCEYQLDEVGYWTEIKLNIIREYSRAYVTILKKQPRIRHVAYIDAFAGFGSHISKTLGEEIEGSPQIALNVQPKFSHYYFIDLKEKKASRLRQIAAGREDVTVYEGDCNSVLLEKVFPQCRWEDYRRALCLLDPYGLNPNWEVVHKAGQMKSIEIFLNFMIMDANMNVLWENPDKVPASKIQRMNVFWGDTSWREACYLKKPGLFGTLEEKAPNKKVVDAYRKRLKDVAGFKYVPDPMPMRISNGAIIYYLLFASHNETGKKIAQDIFQKYRNRG